MGQLTTQQLTDLNNASQSQPWLQRFKRAAADALNLGNLLNFITGTATIPAGVAFKSVSIGLAYDGKPAGACVMQAAQDGTLLRVELVTWDGSGNLVIKGTANATADVVVSYWVDGRF